MCLWAIIVICVYLILFTGLVPFVFALTGGGMNGNEIMDFIATYSDYSDPFNSPHVYIIFGFLSFAVVILIVDGQWGNVILFNFIDSIRFLPTAYWLLKVCKLLEEYRIDSSFNRRNLKLAEERITKMFERRKSINPRGARDLITSWNVVRV